VFALISGSVQIRYNRDVRGIRGRTMPQHTGHATLCDFSSRQCRRSFHRIFSQQTALTLILLITGSGFWSVDHAWLLKSLK